MNAKDVTDESPSALWQRDALHNLCLADPLWAERYEGWTELGSGGSAVAIRTYSRAAGEDVALKIFPRLTEEDRQRFQQEVRNAQRLTSSVIVRTYSPFLRGSMAWIEMEYVDGPNLRQELERRSREDRPFTPAEALDIAAALASALVAAHQAGVIHRDVKPANVLLPAAGRPPAKLSDFGTSRLTGAARITKTGLLAGTPQFAAPEVIAGLPAGPASDVYSLTLCLYLLLSLNRFPFEVADDASPTQWMKAHLDAVPASIRTFDPRVPGALDTLLLRGLSKEPDRRPTASELLAALEALRGDAKLDEPPSRERTRSPASLVTVLAAAGVLVWGSLALYRARAGAGTKAGLSPDISGVSIAPPASASPVSAAPMARSPVAVPPPDTTIQTPPPSREKPTAPFRAVLRQDLLTVANAGAERFVDLRITLLGPGDRRCTASAPEGLVPGEELHIALEDFEPQPPPGYRPQRVRITARSATGSSRTALIPIP